MLSVPETFERQPHPKNVTEAAIFFDKQFKGWWKLIDLSVFDIFRGHVCIFGQVFGDYRFDLYRKIFKEEDEGLGDKQPKNPGIFWKAKYNQQWKDEIKKRQEKSK